MSNASSRHAVDAGKLRTRRREDDRIGLHVRSSNWDISYSLLSNQPICRSAGRWDAPEGGRWDVREFVTRLGEQFPII